MFIQDPPPPPDVAAFIAAQNAPENNVMTSVTVVARGPAPPVGSGYIMTTVLIVGQTADGAAVPFYVPFMGKSEPLPAVGARCALHHQLRPVEWIGGMEKTPSMIGQAVSRFECDKSSVLPEPAPSPTETSLAGPLG